MCPNSGGYDKMRLLRWFILIVFIITTAVFTITYVNEKRTTDTTIPVITVENELIEVSFEATDEELLQGVTAYDEKDKDITDKVIVESVSKFYKTGVCKVVYAVCDSDNHVANATRKIKFRNYESPKFYLDESLCYSIYDKIDITDAFRVEDCIDGDISRNIIVTSEDFVSSVSGIFNIDISVTNSKGDTSTLKLPIVIEDRSLSAPTITLSEYLVYINKGEELDFASYLVGAMTKAGKEIPLDEVKIESNLNVMHEGTYSVHYYVTDSTGAQGHSILNVIVG
jgi:hypothetical protein